MRANLRASAVAAAALLVAACSGGGSATNAPATSAPGGGGETAAATICTEPPAGTAADVEASVGGNAWGAVSASVGDVITWTNGDPVPHKVALDDGRCTMSSNITGSAPQSLTFNEAGTFQFHCTVHPSMKGEIVIS